jgi:hypothetical protein
VSIIAVNTVVFPVKLAWTYAKGNHGNNTWTIHGFAVLKVIVRESFVLWWEAFFKTLAQIDRSNAH